jgi:hypothetical protein
MVEAELQLATHKHPTKPITGLRQPDELLEFPVVRANHLGLCLGEEVGLDDGDDAVLSNELPENLKVMRPNKHEVIIAPWARIVGHRLLTTQTLGGGVLIPLLTRDDSAVILPPAVSDNQ